MAGEILPTGFEEPELLSIECNNCNSTGSVPLKTFIRDGVTVVDTWQDCLVCYNERYEKRFRLQRKVPSANNI